MSAKIDDAFIEAYMTQKSCTVIVISTKSHYTFHINEWSKVPGQFYVKYKSSITVDLGYFKKIEGRWQFFYRPKGEDQYVPTLTAAHAAFRFVIEFMLNGRFDPRVQVHHDGSCARCHRQLTDPESIKTGFGPDCIKLLNKM